MFFFAKQIAFSSGWEQLVNCRTHFKYWTPLENESEKEIPAEEPVPVTFPNAEGVICPSFTDFVIDQWSPDDDGKIILNHIC